MLRATSAPRPRSRSPSATTPLRPVISSLNPDRRHDDVSHQADGSASATDNQKVAKIWLVIDGKEVAVAYGGSLSYSWNTRKVAKGAHSVTVRAWDAAGNTSSKTVTVYR